MRIGLMTAASMAALIALASPAAAQPVWSGEGALTDSDPQMEGEGARYDDHRLRLQAGQRYRISVDSEAFDPVARLIRVGVEAPVAENDDSAGLNPRINYTPSEGGDYILRIYGFSTDGRGAYTARLEALPPPPPPITTPGTPTPVSGTWLRWDGELTTADAAYQDRHHDDYVVRFEAGQTRYISVEAPVIDPMINVLRADRRAGDPPEILDGDDDTGVGFNSLLAFRAEEAGDYIIRVTSFGQNSTGAYRLWVSQ